MATITRVNYFSHKMQVVNGGGLLDQLQTRIMRGTNTWYAGVVGYLDASRQFTPGLGTSGYNMPVFIDHGSADYDLSGEVGDANAQTGSGVNGWAASLGLEMWTTEYNTSGTYAVNTLLTGSTGDDVGKVEDVTDVNYNDVQICGQCSRGAVTAIKEAEDALALHFWMLHWPIIKVSVAS